jgi:hypothetical protein
MADVSGTISVPILRASEKILLIIVAVKVLNHKTVKLFRYAMQALRGEEV